MPARMESSVSAWAQLDTAAVDDILPTVIFYALDLTDESKRLAYQ